MLAGGSAQCQDKCEPATQQPVQDTTCWVFSAGRTACITKKVGQRAFRESGHEYLSPSECRREINQQENATGVRCCIGGVASTKSSEDQCRTDGGYPGTCESISSCSVCAGITGQNYPFCLSNCGSGQTPTPSPSPTPDGSLRCWYISDNECKSDRCDTINTNRNWPDDEDGENICLRTLENLNELQTPPEVNNSTCWYV